MVCWSDGREGFGEGGALSRCRGLHHDAPREVRADGDAALADGEDDVVVFGGDDRDDGARDEPELEQVLPDLVVSGDLLDLLFFAGGGERKGNNGKGSGGGVRVDETS